MTTTQDVRGLKAPGTWVMVAGSVVGAIGALIFMVIAGDRLGAEAFAPVGNAWNIFFIVATVVLVPLEQYAVREASRDRHTLVADASVHIRVGVLAISIAVGVSWLENDRLFQGRSQFPILLGLMIMGYSLFSVVKGAAAGYRRFSAVGWLLILEGAFRLAALFVVLWLFQVVPEAVAWAMVAAPLAGLALLKVARQDAPANDAVRTPAMPFFASYFLGSGASQVLLAASPLVVKFLGADDVVVSVVTVTFTLFRAPLTLIFSLQGRLLSTLVRWSDAGQHGLLRVAAAKVVLGGGVLVAAAWLVGRTFGPAVVGIFYENDFVPSAELAAWVAAGIIAASTAQILGQLLVARGATSRLAGAWLIALLVAAAVVAGTGGLPEHRVAVAFFAGEATAFAAVGFIVLRTYRQAAGGQADGEHAPT